MPINNCLICFWYHNCIGQIRHSTMKAMPGILLSPGLELKAAPPANWHCFRISPKTPVVVLNLSMTSCGTVANKCMRCWMTFMTCTLMLIILLLITTLPLTISSTMLTNSVMLFFFKSTHTFENIYVIVSV